MKRSHACEKPDFDILITTQPVFRVEANHNYIRRTTLPGNTSTSERKFEPLQPPQNEMRLPIRRYGLHRAQEVRVLCALWVGAHCLDDFSKAADGDLHDALRAANVLCDQSIHIVRVRRRKLERVPAVLVAACFP